MSSVTEVPGYSGRAVRVPAGARFRVIDVEGGQIGDLFLVSAADPAEQFSPAITRLVVFKAFPRPGECFYSNRRRPLATFLEDTSPGLHDMSFAPCDPDMYVELGATGPHPNCRDNFLAAIDAIGVRVPRIPDPLNVFQNSPTFPDGHVEVGPTLSRPGDRIELRAEIDLVAVLTACSVDLPLYGVLPNGERSTPLRLEVLEG